METSGQFTLPDRWGMLEELRVLIRDSKFTDCRFSANHASNYLPIRGTFPTDQPQMLTLIDQVLETRDESLLRPESYRGL
jgi:hypothetical protein